MRLEGVDEVGLWLAQVGGLGGNLFGGLRLARFGYVVVVDFDVVVDSARGCGLPEADRFRASFDMDAVRELTMRGGTDDDVMDPVATYDAAPGVLSDAVEKVAVSRVDADAALEVGFEDGRSLTVVCRRISVALPYRRELLFRWLSTKQGPRGPHGTVG
jgi:hypothetical protein